MAGIMEGGLVSPRTEGTPQDSPLSKAVGERVLESLERFIGKRLRLNVNGDRYVDIPHFSTSGEWNDHDPGRRGGALGVPSSHSSAPT
jgi:hypothetical protein